ncbi:translation initiation factor eIF-2B epsilon subunit, GEF [Ascochyta clinopodiicola]|nr:translation initiation factor eIF-2B epsilon subunit, GEF [Ascochyta clinopodiicola]
MPPKGRKGQDKGKAGEEEREDPLQAVILADPFETRFSPFTLERPRCLLPLANTPLIEYTFEFLANAGVEEIFVYCGAHRRQVEDYINRSKWSAPSSPFSRLELIQSTSHSIGDAMRDLDSRNLLVGDFLLVYGDVVSNLPLEGALAAHRARRVKDKNAIMTMVLREAGTTHRTKARGTSPVFVIDPEKDRCLHFEQMPNRDQSHFLSIDPDLLSGHQEIEIRQDLIDCGIDICTPDVLALWSDNFDFQAPRKGFLHSVLKDYELNGKTFHTHIISDHYAARVRNLHAYDSVSKDIVSRWAYPLCPDSNLVQGQSYRLGKGNIYKEEGVILARDCVINSKTVIGRGTSVGDGSVITNSIIGRHCQIGRNVKIDGAYLWDYASVGDGSVVHKSVIANEASIGRKCTIEEGALISYGVAIGEGKTIRGEHRITRAKRRRESDEELVRGSPDLEVVGKGGDGFEFHDSDEEDEDEVVDSLISSGPMYNLTNLSQESISTLNSDSEADDYEIRHDRSATSSFLSINSQDSQHAANFDHDASASIYDSLVEGHESANIQLELTALRMSTNASDHQVRRAVATSFVKRIHQLTKSGETIKNAVAQVFGQHEELINRAIFDKNQTDKADQVDLMLLLQADLSHKEGGDAILLSVATKLVELDSVEEEGMIQWWEDEKSTENDEMKKVREKTKSLIDFLQQESESESEEDSEEDEDSDLVPSSGGTGSYYTTTPPTAHKRKASEADIQLSPSEEPRKKTLKSPEPPIIALPATPDTNASGNMDSDDDFNSSLSGEDFEDQDSDMDIEDDSDFDMDQDDVGFETQDKDIKPTKQAHEVEFKVFDPAQIQAQQDKQIDELSSILMQPPEASAILLRYMRWNKERLIEQYMEKTEEVLESAGLGQDAESNPPKLQRIQGFCCDICCNDSPDMDTFAMKCGHRFCVDCYRQYLATKIQDEGEAARIRCPGEGCTRIVDSKSLDLLVAADLRGRYHVLLTRTYVDDKENLKWCPAPDCKYAVQCGVKSKELNKVVPTVHCDCGHLFCFGCTLDDHQPAPCSLVKKWLKKCEDDSETANWISANTKECPRCVSTIEKNGGCNHMTCRKCRHEFCWMCMGVWSEHGTSWYNCNRFEEKSGSDARDAQAKSRQSLERYLHYYNRYANHEQSAKLDKDIYLKTEKKMQQLQNSTGMSWIEVQFLDQASQALQQCRQVLKWTYAFAYYLARNNLTEIFEDNQKDLEMAVENLSEMFEKPIDQLQGLKVEMMDKTSYCTKRRIILLNDTAENLKQGNWEFIVSLT